MGAIGFITALLLSFPTFASDDDCIHRLTNASIDSLTDVDIKSLVLFGSDPSAFENWVLSRGQSPAEARRLFGAVIRHLTEGQDTGSERLNRIGDEIRLAVVHMVALNMGSPLTIFGEILTGDQGHISNSRVYSLRIKLLESAGNSSASDIYRALHFRYLTGGSI